MTRGRCTSGLVVGGSKVLTRERGVEAGDFLSSVRDPSTPVHALSPGLTVSGGEDLDFAPDSIGKPGLDLVFES